MDSMTKELARARTKMFDERIQPKKVNIVRARALVNYSCICLLDFPAA